MGRREETEDSREAKQKTCRIKYPVNNAITKLKQAILLKQNTCETSTLRFTLIVNTKELGSRKDKAKAVDSLPTYLGLVYEQLQLGPRMKSGTRSTPIVMFQERIDSAKEEKIEYDQLLYLQRFYVMQHLESQVRRAEDDIRMYSKATEDYKRLEEGVGTQKELEAFKLLFPNL